MGMFGELRLKHGAGGRVLVKQAELEATDINAIVRRYVAHGVAPPASGRTPRYGDFSSGYSFHQALDQVMEAERQFFGLPAAVRDRCQNDVGVFLEACSRKEELQELLELGLDPEWVPAKPEEPRGASIQEIRDAFKIPEEEKPEKASKDSKPAKKGEPAS